MKENEAYQKRTYALATGIMLFIFVFWTLCVTAPLKDVELAKFIASALVTPFGVIVYFFFRKPKKDVSEGGE